MNSPSSAVELLQQLVQIPSVNPSGDPGTDSVGELAMAEYLREFLTEIGAEVELREVEPGRPNVVARFPSATPGKPRLLFAPHTDTVSVAGMTVPPFGGELRDGRIWGRGASDTKGPMASMLWALKEAGQSIQSLSHEIWFAGLVGEESGQPGSKALAAQERFDFVIAGEPTGLDVVHTHKGALWMTLETHGTAVHASTPELGSNAIYKMADIMRFIRDDLAQSLALLRDPILGPVTISAGIIRGGSKTNIVPDHCRAELDIRTIPNQPGLLESISTQLRTIDSDLKIDSIGSPPMFTDPAHPLIQALSRNGSKLIGAPWFCDAAVFAKKGIAAIALGPGSIAQAHTKDEWIAVADLEEGVDFFHRFLSGLGR